MNFVKGFLRRSSGSAAPGSSSSIAASSTTSATWIDVQFSDHGVEESLHHLWQEYENLSSEDKRKSSLGAFLRKFNDVYERWVPLEEHQSGDGKMDQTGVTGCSFGHPTAVILGLLRELKLTSDYIGELHANSDSKEPVLATNEMESALRLLNALSILSRASNNRAVFSTFGGLQTLTSVMKNSVVYIKSISDAATPNMVLMSFLQCLLAHVVSIMANFIELEKLPDKSSRRSSLGLKENAEDPPRRRLSFRQRPSQTSGENTSFALLLETGGLNWFVELLRVLRKLHLATDEHLERVTLQTLKAAVSSSSRAQNHFRSIGGLEVLLDGLGYFRDEGSLQKLVESFNLQVLSLEVTREAVFRNVNSLQSVCDIGGLHKFIRLFRWAAFSFPVLYARSTEHLAEMSTRSSTTTQEKEKDRFFLGIEDVKDNYGPWNSNVSRLCEVLCSFVIATWDIFSLSGPASQETSGVTSVYWENATRLVVNVLLGIFRNLDDNDEGFQHFKMLLSSDLQRNIITVFKKMLAVSSAVLQLFRDEGVWTVMFSNDFFYFGLEGKESLETQPLQLEVISFVELAATTSGNSNNLAECNALVQSLEQCSKLPSMATMLLKSLHRILQLTPELTSSSFKELQVILVLSEVMAALLQDLRLDVGDMENLLHCRDAAFSLFNECLSLSDDAKSSALRSTKLMDVLFGMILDSRSRTFAIHHVSNFMKVSPISDEDQDAKMELCMKYLETLSRVQSDQHSAGIDIVLDLLSILRDVLQCDFPYYQALFREVECFVHIVSLLNEAYPEEHGKRLCLEVIATLIHLLKGNEASKLAFRSLVGPGYKMLETLLVNRYGYPTQDLLNALWNMLVDGTFDNSSRMIIQNEDVIVLLLNFIHLCDPETQLKALDTFLQLLEESTANQSSCVRAGLLCSLMDWFSSENESVVLHKLCHFIKLAGGHSMAGKEMRRMFSLLRSTSSSKNNLILSTFKSMLSEQGPSVFFELSGKNSGIGIKTPFRWPINKGFSFMCWIRLESVSSEGMMSLFSFLTGDGKGCAAFISADKFFIEVDCANHKKQATSMSIRLESKKWHFICVTHTTGRALSTGSLCKIFVDGKLSSSEKLRYPKVYDPVSCTIGANATADQSSGFFSPLCGQLGPVYLFDDVLTPGQVEGVFMLGAGYMYSFLPSEAGCIPANMSDSSLSSSKEGLSSKMIFGYNALASSGRVLFDVAPVSEQSDAVSHEATIMSGTQLCYRCLVQNNIHCVGGITVFFPLLTRFRHAGKDFDGSVTDADDYYLADVIELLTAVATKNYVNQKFLHSSGGLGLLGYLLQFVSIKQLSVKVITALNNLLRVLSEAADNALSDLLVRETVLKVYLNPSAWIYAPYVIQRELFLSLINFLETRKYGNVCGVSRFLDMLHQFYWDKPKHRKMSKTVGTRDRPRQEELSQLRILILSLAETAIRDHMSVSDAKSLISFIDRNDDLICVEEVLQMLLGLLGDPIFLSSFLECVHSLGGIHIFLNLLSRQQEVIRLLALHVLGSLFLAIPVERKSIWLFGIGGNKGQGDTVISRQKDLVWSIIKERLLQFPFTDSLRVTLFDLLLGAAIPKQVLHGGILTQFGKSSGKRAWLRQLQAAGNPAHTATFPEFFLPQVLGVLLKFVEASDDWTSRQDVLKDILALIQTNPANCGVLLQEPGWQDWLFAVFSSASSRKQKEDQDSKRWADEVLLIRKIFCALQVHAVFNTKGGWRQVERMTVYVLKYTEQSFLHDLLGDIVSEISDSRSLLTLQPCRDNVLYLLALIEELVVADAIQYLPFLNSPAEESEDNGLLSGSYVDLGSETGEEGLVDKRKNSPRITYQSESSGFNQRLYDQVWDLLSAINGIGQGGASTSTAGPTFGQRARGLVESLNLPAAEVAAVVTGGLGSVGINVPSSKPNEKAMKLRGEKFSRLAFRLVLVYLYRAGLEAVLLSVQQFLPLVPGFLSSDSDQNKGQLYLAIWCLLDARSQVENMDDGTRSHVLSQLIEELIEIGKVIGLVDKEKRTEETMKNDPYSFLQQDKVKALVRDDKKFLRAAKRQWVSAVETLNTETNDTRSLELRESKALEEQSLTVLNSIHNSELSRRAAYQLKEDAEEQAVASQWCLIFRNLTDERGPWSSTTFPSDTLVWWKLDKTEDPLRRRLKLKRNYHFDQKLVQPAASTEGVGSQSAPRVLSREKVSFRKAASFKLEKESEEVEDEMQDANDEFVSNESEAESSSTSEADGAESKQGAAEDEVLLSVSCVLVSPKRKLAGRLEVTHRSLHFHMEFFIEGTGGSMVFDSSGGFARQNQDTDQTGTRDGDKAQHRTWDIFQVTAIYATRYLLQHTALEIFFADAAPPVFLNFASHQVAKDVALKITSSKHVGSKGKAKHQIHFVDRKRAIDLAEKARDCWRRRECSNFDYLMILNTLSGRSYNDLTQYPVFPWILSDYSSEALDLSSPSVYRDLAKPVGALDEKRFQVFEERYNNFTDPDIPSFHYGSHYSSMGIVLFYLLRLEPFSSFHRTLQGGKFDHADRLFHSIQNTYANCLTNTSDVKEIIPEFFYMPEFLVNTNSYYIGVKQDGQHLNNVILPPWAKGSPEEFIRLNREALESEHTSENLHRWIDLIFGYKQRGKPAVEAANIFYYLTYEGTVELETMEDARQRASVEDQIANFGQTPIQLFKKKHPKRGPPVPLLRPLYYSPASTTLVSTIPSRSLSFGKSDEDHPVLYIGHCDGKIISVTSQMVVSSRMWLTPSMPPSGSFTFSSSQDSTYGLGSEEWPCHKVRGYFTESFPDSFCFCALPAISTVYLISCGHWDNSFKLMSLTDGQTVQSLCQHKDVVTCASVAADGSIVATGSRDTTVMVWETQLSSNRTKRSDSKLAVSDKPRHVLCGHDDAVTCVVVRTELDLVVSGSEDGTCILYTLRQGRYVRSLVHPSRKSISLLVVSPHGLVGLFSNKDLNFHSFSVNGKHLASAELNGRLSCMELSSCGEFVVCGGDQGYVTVRKLHSLELVHRYDTAGSPIVSLCVTPEDCFLVGTRDGRFLIYAVETSPRREKR
ncbi:BEACH domain-containing protein B isoform X1 [Selaginella moellendorffii]|uniref:BEACH domain-containing protein B isoform X1 n=2 Tax=Selaginella moellendorffii TaxID=88036 RepID=UPI000D1C70D0|nr:BEACH domain-containing protein B isoform X1 [Selaginella moellendorffii]|eukprot:XP_024540202.1 BEACH domain-containing protein B isoform X1 [Selaginella moellendorffii]